MSSNRLSGLNVALLAVTLAALLFGLYGFMRPQQAADNQQRHTRRCEAGDSGDRNCALSRGRDAGKPRETDKPDPSAIKPENPPKETASPQDPVPEAKAGGPSDKGDAKIAGVVLTAEGRPVAGATVSARRSNFNMQSPVVDSRDPARSREAVARYLAQAQGESRFTLSDKEGRFAFVGLDGKLSYDLSATLEGTGKAHAERVAAGDSATLILQPLSWLVGRVVGPQEAPVTQFRVKVYRRNRQWEAKEQVFLSQDGRFQMECDGGVMMVDIQASGFTQGSPTEVTIDASTAEHVFTLSQAAILTGTVRDRAGTPLANAIVFTGNADNRWGNGRNYYNGYEQGVNTRTDTQGRYRFDTLAPAEYTFTAAFGESKETKSLTLSVGENSQDFALDAGVRVVLRLKDMRGKPVDAEQVWFMRKNNEWVQAERLPAREPGVAEFAGLRPDDYTMSISASGFPSLRREIKLTGGQQVIDLELPDGAMLGGKITSTSGGALTGISVRLVKEGENENEAWGTGRWAQVQQDGSYRIGPVEPGLWSVDVMGQDWRKVGGEKRNLVVGENKFDLSMNTGGTLVVRIADESGKSAGWAYVSLEGLNGSGKRYAAQSGQQGIATINFIEPGEYSLRVSAQGQAAPAVQVNVHDGKNEATVTLKKPNCARVTYVTPNTQASRIGLQVGDLIVEYNNEKVMSWEDVGRIRRKYREGDDVTMTIERNGQLQTFNLKGGQIGIDGESAVR